jgi:hypothetical protein
MIAAALPVSAIDGTRAKRRHRRFPSRTSNKSGDSVGADADANNSNNPNNNPRLRRLERLRLSSSLQHKAMMQKRVETQQNDDFAHDMRFSSETLEGMLLRIPSGSLTVATTDISSSSSSSSSSVGSVSDGSGTGRRRNILQMAKRRVTSPRRTQQQHKASGPPPSPAPLHRVDSAVSSLGCSKFTDTPDGDHLDEHGIDDTEEDMLSASKFADVADNPSNIPRLAVALSFEQIREDVDSFEREAAVAVATTVKTPLVVDGQNPVERDDKLPRLCLPVEPSNRVSFCKEDDNTGPEDEGSKGRVDDDASRTASYYCDRPHLLAGSEDELSCERNMAGPALSLSAHRISFCKKDDNTGPEDEGSKGRVDDDASRTTSYYCDRPHLLAGSEDELSCERNMVELALPLHVPPSTGGHHCYEEMDGMYHTPDIPTERKILASMVHVAVDSTGPNSPTLVAEYDDDDDREPHTQRQQMPQNESFPQCPSRREKCPVRALSSVHFLSKETALVDDAVGELPSLSLCTSPYSSYMTDHEEQPFDVIGSPQALSPHSNSFDITVTAVEETPFDEGSGFVNYDGGEENPFDECRPISPLRHPANRHKSQLTATESGATKSAHKNRQASTASDLANSSPDSDLIIDFDPQLLERKKESLADGRHNITLSEDEDPTFMESLTYARSDGRLTPGAYNGTCKRLSQSCGTTSPSGAHEEDEPSI